MPSEKNVGAGQNHASNDFEIIKPAQFENPSDLVSSDERRPGDDRPLKKTKTPLILTLLGLTACLLFVIFWLPKIVGNQEHQVATAPNSAGATSVKSNSPAQTTQPTAAPVAAEESPYSAAQLAQQRKDAQAALEKLLEQQKELEALSVNDWADAEFKQAVELATVGDTSYRQRQFLDATQNYNKANDILQAALENKDEFINKVIAQGNQELKLGQKDAAIESFSLVQKIEPDNNSAANGLKRAETIEKVFPLFAQALNQSEEDQVEEAISTYEEILKIDPLASDATSAISTLKAKRNDQQFSRYMSRGLAAIDAGNASSAREYFNKAAALKPNNKGVKDGLRQASRMQSNARVNGYLSTASKYQDQEDWGKVIETLDTAIAKEGKLSGFTDRRDAAAIRLQLDQRLQKLINNPELLSDDNTYKAAEKLLTQARSTSPSGRKLNGQIAQAEQLLSVSLKPGKYVITGARNGYRDVREEVILTAADNGKTIRIICTQPI